jgi:hypothetical protein
MQPWSRWHGLGDDTPWVSFDCAGSKRWRYLADGRVEIEEEGSPASAWPSAVDQWRDPVLRAALLFGIPPSWIATIMSIESGGRPGLCLRKSDGSCSSSEGVGLMTIMSATASTMAGRKVSWQELLEDNALNIELGSKYLKYQLDQYGGDPVKASVAYNAGSVRCGQGRVFGTRDEPCPRTDWNVVEGCVRSAQGHENLVCAPSEVKDGQYVCSIDRPRQFIKALNAAILAGWDGKSVPGPEPVPGTEEPERKPASPKAWLAMLLGAAGGYLLVHGVRCAADYAAARKPLQHFRRTAAG